MLIFFFRKTILSFYAIFNIEKNNIEKCPFTYWLNGRWFLQIVDRDSWNLYPLYPLFPCSDFVSQMWGWFGGGEGCNVFLTFYAISNISRKKVISRGAEGPGREIFHVCPSVCPSVRPSRLVFAL